MSSNKFRRAYSLRIPLSQKSAAFLDSSGCYDRLEEAECQYEYGQNDNSGKRDHSPSWEIPLITEAPKLHCCRKKWSSKSLRLPKTRQADAGSVCQPQEVTRINHNNRDLNQESDKPTSDAERRLSSDVQSLQEEENEGDKQKGKKIKHYKKTIDRAFRRGWDTFITNIYTISLARTSQDSPYLVKAC
ncbi:uncharacterized protein PAF06_014982 [Gastrophryne carolinensis]